MADEEQKVEYINVKVEAQDGSVVEFTTKKNAPLRKLMQMYCKGEGIQLDDVRFHFYWRLIKETDTPENLAMEDDDTIHVFHVQKGGTGYVISEFTL